MANDRDLNVSYTVDPAGLSGDMMRLPQVSRRMTRDEVMLARGTADALALHRRYHNGQTHAKYAPQGEMARDLYEAMETARCEAMGARDMPGTAGNIDAKIANEAMRKGYDQVKQASEVPLSTAAGYLIRHLATGRQLPAGAQNARLFPRYLVQAVAQPGLMVKCDTGDHRNGGIDNIDRVQTTTETHFKHGDIHAAGTKNKQRRQGGELEITQGYLTPRRINLRQRTANCSVVNIGPGHPDTLIETLQMWRRIHPCNQARITCQRLQYRHGRPLAIGASHGNHRPRYRQ
jgi:hypothetical protein